MYQYSEVVADFFFRTSVQKHSTNKIVTELIIEFWRINESTGDAIREDANFDNK